MAETVTYYTGEMVRELMDRSPTHWPRYETVFGELLVTPAPTGWHQEVAFRLCLALREYLGREPSVGGHPFLAPADISWGRRDVLVQPDVFVVPKPEGRAFRWGQVTRLLLAAEVVSPSSRHTDRFTKRHLYQDERTPLYWVIDPDKETADAWTPDAVEPRPEPERLLWHPPGAGEPFTLPLVELFRPI